MGNFINCLICKKPDENLEDLLETKKHKKKYKSDVLVTNEIVKTLEKEISQNNGSESIYIENSSEISDKKVSIEDFRILRVLGRGSFGKVLLVEKKDSSFIKKKLI